MRALEGSARFGFDRVSTVRGTAVGIRITGWHMISVAVELQQC